MRSLTHRRRSVSRMIGLAAMSGLGLQYLNDDTLPGGGGGGEDDKKKKEKPKDDADKVTLTAAERDKLIADAKADAKREYDESRKAEKDELEKADLEKKGEVQKLLDKEREAKQTADDRVAELELKVKRADVKDQLRRHLEEKHKEYVASLDDIFLHIAVEADTKDDEIAKRIEAAAKGFATRNPRGRVAPAPPPAPNRSDRKPNDGNGDKPIQFTGASRHY